jgi:hypothetical protein
MSILFDYYKQLTEYTQQVEQIEVKGLQQQKMEEEDLQPPRQLKLSEF